MNFEHHITPTSRMSYFVTTQESEDSELAQYAQGKLHFSHAQELATLMLLLLLLLLQLAFKKALNIHVLPSSHKLEG